MPLVFMHPQRTHILAGVVQVLVAPFITNTIVLTLFASAVAKMPQYMPNSHSILGCFFHLSVQVTVQSRELTLHVIVHVVSLRTSTNGLILRGHVVRVDDIDLVKDVLRKRHA